VAIYVARVDQPGNVVTDVFSDEVFLEPPVGGQGRQTVYFAVEGRFQAGNSESRTSQNFTSLVELVTALRSQDDVALNWSPYS
jgi:hypothetical protein